MDISNVPDYVWIAIETLTLGLGLGYVVGRRARAKIEERQEQEKQRQEKPEQERVTLDNVLGLDKALTAKFYHELRKAIADGRVKVALVSDECNGYVAYDFARESWICVNDSGIAPLDGKPAEDYVEIYDEVAGDDKRA